MIVYCQIAKCTKRADFSIYNKPVCNTHGHKIQELKKANPQAFIHWKNPCRQPRKDKPQPRIVHPYFTLK